ncbi:hypothetical protein EMIHUDRAFT_447344 [Emiliania huxleyi CCMP1516]|uniref:Uncharacterized protein n=2 Tax=Emiliania huxleyi TaxID=2903 RepID=A0A0D3I3L8_EMIH1|nr:hypothetical protein EMIHUDRAFT_447344 [Emiliania huxleyi CCMP1516]EOD05853.1 hypothetical protein EMIHUDRAFT_447344 [Emiliania huxleyi CCMP1516]|eukprot:XP_005758282.1 hypothetical protein EMIHUDRAFT_447344 [Emiliania huxleyi CCMP1516]
MDASQRAEVAKATGMKHGHARKFEKYGLDASAPSYYGYSRWSNDAGASLQTLQLPGKARALQRSDTTRLSAPLADGQSLAAAVPHSPPSRCKGVGRRARLPPARGGRSPLGGRRGRPHLRDALRRRSPRRRPRRRHRAAHAASAVARAPVGSALGGDARRHRGRGGRRRRRCARVDAGGEGEGRGRDGERTSE